MKRKVWPVFLAFFGCVVVLILWQQGTFAAFATSNTLFDLSGERLGGEHVEVVAQIGGRSHAVTVVGNYAYLGIGPSLVILDISDARSPMVVGQEVLPDLIRDIAVAGDYAYVANDNNGGLRIINIANPSSPQEVGFYDTVGTAWGVAIAGDYAYLAASSRGLQIINIANPTAPQEIGSYETASSTRGVAIAGDHAYVVDGDLQIINIANPNAPQAVASYQTPGDANDVVIAGSHAYVADGSAGLQIIDIANPAAPQEIGSIDTLRSTNGVAIAGDYAYLTDSGLQIINIANPNAPQDVTHYDTPGNAQAVFIAGNEAYVADRDDGLRIIDIANPQAPQEIGFYDTSDEVEHVFIAEQYAYVSGTTDELGIIHVANPSAPQQAGFYDSFPSGMIIRDIAAAKGYAYVASTAGLRLIDVQNPSAAQEVGSYDTFGFADAVAIAGDYAYVATSAGILQIINISNPSAPQEVGHYDTFGIVKAVAIAGDYAYLAASNNGLRIINISNPAAPQEVASYDTSGLAEAVAIAGNYAYVAASSAGLRIINISNPSAPQEAGSYNTSTWAYDVAIAGNYAYVAVSNGGLRIINIKNPSAPQEVSSYDTSGEVQSVAIADNHVYVAHGSDGLVILRFTGGTTPTPIPTSTRTATPTNTPRPNNTPTAMPINTATPNNTPIVVPTMTAQPTQTPSPTSTPAIGLADSYESDDVCEEAGTITSNGIMQSRTFHQPGDRDWVSVEVIEGTEYLIEALTPADSTADVVLSVYDGCESVPSEGQDPSFSPDIRLQFVAPSTGTIYLELSNDNLEAAGVSVAYDLSVRALADEATTGTLILVGGRYRSNDPLQSNIHHVTNSVYQLFLAHGYTDDHIYYLATEEIDINNDGINDVDASPTNRNLELAITQWARDKVDSQRALTIYMISHGTIDRLYLNGISQTLNPTELDSWLDELESAAPGLNVNLIVEACHAGSFIELEESVSEEGRVVIASTGTHPLAYASENGAYFSDAFIGALGRGKSLYGAFEEARTIAQTSHPDQTAWLDDNGDQLPNRANDGLAAQQRGFAFANGLPAIQWAPYISEVEMGDITNENGIITARVEDDQGVLSVWADIYKPSYAPPDNSAEEMPLETLPSIRLRDENGDGIYSGLYENFSEQGEYRLVIYAMDVENLQGEPVSLKVQVGSAQQQLYLPLLMR